MKAPSASAILAVAVLSSCTLAIVTLPIARIRDAGAVSKFRRRNTITEILGNNETSGLYTAQAMVGTPAQPITFQIDTGSSDVWMLSATADLCTDPVLQRERRRGGCLTTCEFYTPSLYHIC